jgi:Fur family peroxide stress response transcriptional regulator
MEDPQARLEELVEKLREREYRITPQRLAILRILSASDGHPSAEHIFDQIKVEFPTTSLATVYKTIARLKLALAILNEEVEHESWFAEFLGEGPSGHGGVRREGGYSPHVSKFMT